MTNQTDMVNRALQTYGSRTTVTAAELATNGSNEAIQANIAYVPFRRRLLRMAPWACAFQTANLTYITSVPGTPENTSAATQLWAKGQPAPPWAYEYQYPVDCLRMCWLTPQTAVGFASGVPITTAVTGGSPSFWQGPPVKFNIAVDQFFCVVPPATVIFGGTGYQVNDILTLLTPTFLNGAPGGAPALLRVTAAPAGVISTVDIISQIRGESPVAGGSYFAGANLAPPFACTGGTGTGATFSLNFSGPFDQRVILTNQEFAISNYVKDITDENIFDDDFQEAYALILGARLCIALSGDKSLANMKIAEANAMILEARGTDANEGLRVNDITPDWLRIRGIDFVEDYSGPYNTGFNWGSIWPGFT